ncbi:MAG TPA: calcium:proton antiporter [Candidatus Bathyarchaeia archaeon]|nr:calcium:proton antiporter [Candidatus Bathyarchaeia archaeon]
MKPSDWLKEEWPLAASFATAGLFLAYGAGWLADLSSTGWFAFVSLWLLAAMFLSAFAVVRHAEALAVKLGEPYGTLVLTLAITGIEVIMIAAIMYAGKGNATLARDAMMAVVMIVLNGMLGLTLIVGGLRYREQAHNLQGANSFLAVILPLAVLGLVQPNFTVTTPGPVYSPVQAAFLSIMSLVLYAVFLGMQTSRHREYFLAPNASAEVEDPSHGHGLRSVPHHAVMLFLYIVPFVALSKQIAVPINHAIRVLHAPPELAGLLVSVLILSPESLTAVRAALANQLQRSVNVLLGSVLASIGLTIPLVLAVGFVTGQQIVLGLGTTDITLLILTLALSMVTFASQRTNVLLGTVHLVVFFAYLLFIFER